LGIAQGDQQVLVGSTGHRSVGHGQNIIGVLTLSGVSSGNGLHIAIDGHGAVDDHVVILDGASQVSNHAGILVGSQNGQVSVCGSDLVGAEGVSLHQVGLQHNIGIVDKQVHVAAAVQVDGAEGILLERINVVEIIEAVVGNSNTSHITHNIVQTILLAIHGEGVGVVVV